MAAIGVVVVSSRGCPIRTLDWRILWCQLLGNVLKLVVVSENEKKEGGSEEREEREKGRRRRRE